MTTPLQGRHFHAVRFYQDPQSLCDIVARFVAQGLEHGEPGVVIATPAHVNGILERLASGHDVPALRADRRLVFLDAQDTLDRFVVHGSPHGIDFWNTIVPVFKQVTEGRGHCTVRAYGEMVDVLWKAGLTPAASKVEMLWNHLALSHSFALLCGYAMDNFYQAAAVDEICSHHSHVVSSAGTVTAVY
jgi:hypothetical protein